MKFSVAATLAAVASTVAVAAPLQTRGHSGVRGTWFTQNGNAGSCGDVHSDNDFIVAVSAQHHRAENCGKTISITGPNGNTQKAVIADTCPGCGEFDLDLSTGLFKAFGSLDQGVLDLSWAPTW
ncbi:unnamed protein product [Parajaminaea phylloscopi]